MRPRHLPVVVLAVLVASAACGGGSGSRPVGGPAPANVGAAMAPASAVEQFMGFAAQQRYTEMGYVFGTARGPLAEQQAPARVNRRMQAIASVLRHDTYAMTGVVPVVDRPDARQVTVQIRRGQRTMTVPFTVVQGPGGRWLVEVVDLEAAMDVRRS
ncbi:hypothetical protein [Longimicrobium sp.]|uniref:hypothetical protein n=1 Tax=Longimicrobium sp. TaxID=2029185 RepID=UPI003B3BD32E